MEVSKIHLSSAEFELMQNEEIILTKNRVLEKMRSLLTEVQEKQIDFLTVHSVSETFFRIPPKISKGENYLGLPYLILDYPRLSSAPSFFFIRTMFWWGHYFSCTLHISGQTKEVFKDRIKQNYRALLHGSVSVSNDPWAHRLEGPDYRQIGSMSPQQFEEACDAFEHLKIAVSHPLTEWVHAPSELYDDWKMFLSVCGLIA